MAVPAGLLHAAQMQRHTSASKILEAYVAEPRYAHLGSELGRGGEFADGFGKVAVRVGRPGDEAADDREDSPAVEVVHGAEEGVRGRTEFEDRRHASGTKDAAHFREAGF